MHPAFAGDDRHHWAPSRKALAAEFELRDQRLFVIVCHFKSMRSTTRREVDYAKKQRHTQAQIVHGFAADLLACDPQAAIVLLGDLNDVLGSKTLKLLKGESFHNLLEDLPRGQAYTRRHGGQPQALDHILVSPALRRGATAHIPHLNSDTAPGAPEPASDHDPVVAMLPALPGA
jgi:predicted extracellular nuclease